MDDIPKKYNSHESESRLQKFWDDEGVYRFNPDGPGEIFSIDTPPPTVSGKMHLGHAFSYAQQDFLVRYKRMRGFNIFYPFGTDDNGIPTERLIEKEKKVKAHDMPRQEFVKLCLETLEKELRPKCISDWKRIGMSCDWNVFYTTIDPHCQKISQRSFIELYNMGRQYRKDAPAMWCPQCQTGISQVECQDKELDSTSNDIVFGVDADDLVIATTRPELLPACVAVFYHPDDERFKKYAGKKAKVPLFDFEVPIMADARADPEKGTGIVMCCTFGDQTDMEWQKAHNLPIKNVLTVDGKLTEIAGKYKGLDVKQARKEIIEDLKANSLLVSEKPIRHTVNVHERCGTEIEIIHSKQWFIKYLDLKDEMLAWGQQLNWYPDYMRVRYEHWVNGLAWDWLISRQRYFGIPFPVWYCKDCDEIILAKLEDIPVDPTIDEPPVKQCPKCKSTEFIPETDVLDTWATSSLTPQLACELFKDHPVYEKLYPMSLRPQAHDIITFWLFNTVVKSRMHNQVNPWSDVVISGHAQDSRGKKMSKSRGNAVEPQEMIEKYSADSLRFWAAGSKLGEDLPFKEKDLITGEKFITKLWNASRFVFMHLDDYDGAQVDLAVTDRWLLSKLSKIVAECTDHFDRYEYMHTKALTEKFFWQTYCDYYLELVKERLYKPEIRGDDSRKAAQYTLYHSLLTILKLAAPIMPHITEEIYQTFFKEREKDKSIHISGWPTAENLLTDADAVATGDLLINLIGKIRKYKSDNKLALGSELDSITVSCNADAKKKLESVVADICGTGRIKEVKFAIGESDELGFSI